MFAVINRTPVTFDEGETILEVARRHGIFVPTLCEFAALNHRPGTCRMCLAEVRHEGETDKQIVTTCDTLLQDRDTVDTRSDRVRTMQRLQAELLFSDHCEKCSGCARHGHCELQAVAARVGLDTAELTGTLCDVKPETDKSAAGLVFTADKCIRCLRCVEVCRRVQGIGAITLNGTGTQARIGFDKGTWADSNRCVQCGQCALVCPTGALAVRDDTDTALSWLEDPKITTVFQFAPAVRIAIAESVGAAPGTNLEGQIVAALKALGADYVLDTRWSADVTILEEGTELLARIRAARASGTGKPDTMFTSCCPGWINHIEKNRPDMIPHISTTRSPQAILGALVKTYLPETKGIDAACIRHISIMPCTAKKDEAGRELLKHNGARDVDLVLTVQEFAQILKRFEIDLKTLAPAPFDSPFMTESSGAAELFATTGGVMEAALRTVCALTGGPALNQLALVPVRGLVGTREASLQTKELGTVRVAVCHGLREADKIIELVREGTCPYDFVEVMACPGGCISGGGTVRGPNWGKTLVQRQEGVYRMDDEAPIRTSHENPDVQRLYSEWLGEPCGHKSHELLHCTYENRQKQAYTMSVREIQDRLELD